MFVNRKSIDQMTTPNKFSANGDYKSPEKRVSPMYFQSQELVQDFQKEPLYLLTLSGKNQSKQKSTIYLTTTKDMNQDPSALMQGLSNFMGKQKNDLLEKFVFKILAGTNSNSPMKI